MRLQIIAKGYQTYGQDYKIDKAEMTFGIRMKRPGEQYSIYKNHDQDAKSQDPEEQKDDESEAQKPATSDRQDKPTDSTPSPRTLNPNRSSHRLPELRQSERTSLP